MKTSPFPPYPIKSLLLAMAIAGFPLLAGAKPYKGAEIYTHGAQLYGKYVIHMRVAKGGGVVSAFFLWKDGSEMPEIPWGEIDIEVLGRDNAQSWQSNIITGMDSSRITSEQEHDHDFSFGDAYHTFTIEWAPNSLTWRVDGDIVRTSAGEQVNELISETQIRLSIWASESVEWAGAWDESILPVTMRVDWVEYYAWNGADFQTDPAWRDDFDSFDTTHWGKADWTFDGNRVDFIPENAYVDNGALVLALTAETQSSSSSSSASSSSSSGGGSGGGGGIGLLIAAFWGLFLKRMYRLLNGA